jgi:hypothetical protein
MTTLAALALAGDASADPLGSFVINGTIHDNATNRTNLSAAYGVGGAAGSVGMKLDLGELQIFL